MITLQAALEKATNLLAQGDSNEARREAQILLGHVLGVERAILYAYPERPLTLEEEERFFQLVERCRQGEPVAYLTGHKEFYGRDFLVDKRVLIPRPETEFLIEEALRVIQQKYSKGIAPIVADIGTGSGIIPITLALEEPRLPYLYATDISPDALAVARSNAELHQVEQRLRLLQGDLLTVLPEQIDILTANLPYVGTDEIDVVGADVLAYEPHLALFSGPKGLDLLHQLFSEIQNFGILKGEAVVLLEIGYQQREALTGWISELWPDAQVSFSKDYAGWDRLLKISY